uniref:Uncharacterized protein n=1 Tax=Oryza punctata TaxID=4537 RepID=A0A0E0KEG8_ORYPU
MLNTFQDNSYWQKRRKQEGGRCAYHKDYKGSKCRSYWAHRINITTGKDQCQLEQKAETLNVSKSVDPRQNCLGIFELVKDLKLIKQHQAYAFVRDVMPERQPEMSYTYGDARDVAVAVSQLGQICPGARAYCDSDRTPAGHRAPPRSSPPLPTPIATEHVWLC